MSEELKDLRCKISTLTACYLEAESREQGGDKCDLVRAILDSWAAKRHGASITAQKLLAAEGVAAPDAGGRGRGPLRWD